MFIVFRMVVIILNIRMLVMSFGMIEVLCVVSVVMMVVNVSCIFRKKDIVNLLCVN